MRISDWSSDVCSSDLLALIDSARHSLDLQYYVWWGDESGSLLLSRVVAAADRGVKVRILVDDLTTNVLVETAQERLGDTATATIGAHPNIDVRVFNPWRQRTLVGQFFESKTGSASCRVRVCQYV